MGSEILFNRWNLNWRHPLPYCNEGFHNPWKDVRDNNSEHNKGNENNDLLANKWTNFM